MATPGTTRRRVLSAAASIPFLTLAPIRAEPVEAFPLVDLETWGRNLTRYREFAARAKKAEESGWFRAANERFYRAMADPDTDRKAAFARMTRAENLYWHRCTAPMQEAAVALVLTPAPDLEAVSAKLAVIRAHQLYEPKCMERGCFDLLEEDVGRLTFLTTNAFGRSAHHRYAEPRSPAETQPNVSSASESSAVAKCGHSP